METPICVVDARTLIDHVHDIKKWIYNGQLRIVVPSATYEIVEQINQKTKEPKLTTKEAPRPKSTGKPVKKEYPAFDINPLLTRGFLSRLKAWKEGEAVSEQREFFQGKENHRAVSFQQFSEQYTPWKDVEIEEEKPQVAEDRPTTWAEALRRKQNLANGGGGNSLVPKGPAKPKLVAKTTGSEPSPWKIKKDAPMISAKDVPGNLRPLMSCALWRLHESIDRNDANELFLLSDQPEIRTVAQKLNIIVRSSKELGVLITAKAKRLDLDAYGDLERDFDLPRRVINRPELKPITHVEGQEAPEKSESNGTKSEDSKNASESREEKGKTLDDNASEDEGNAVPSKDSEEPHGRKSSENEDEETPAKVTVAKMLENSATVLGLTDLIAKSEPDGNGKRQEETASNGSSPNTSDADHSDIAALRHQKPDEAQTKADSAASNSFSSKNASTYSTPENRILKYDSSPARSSALPPLLRPNAPAQEPEDSDEEVVVFVPQPKRFSNHKKPIQQNSRPATPITQPHKQFFDQSPKASPIAAQVQSKPPSRGRNSTITSHGHPQPTSAPTIIDPDAFGRDFAVNTNSGPRTLPNHRPHHRQKRSTENAQLTPNSHDRRQHDPRISPNRQLPHTRSPRLSPARQPNSEEGQSTQSQRPQRTSPQRRSKPSEPKEATFRGRGPNHANPGANPELKSLATRMVESEEFVPRSAFTESQNGSMFAQPSIVEPQNLIPKAASPAIQDKPTTPKAQFVKPESFTPRNSEPTSQNKPRVIEPRASGADGFVPRSAMTRMPYKPRIPEPEVIEPRSSMPDVQYVLKSGSTRAATRGRGRLWTPS